MLGEAPIHGNRGSARGTAVSIIGISSRPPGSELSHDFDAEFFGLSDERAALIAPRHRATLELIWEALEDAFVLPESLRGGQVGVFTGAAGLVTEVFGTSGPSVVVEDSLVAVELAAASLRAGECVIALAGGACRTGSGDVEGSVAVLKLEQEADGHPLRGVIEPVTAQGEPSPQGSDEPVPLVLSGKNDAALRAQAAALYDQLDTHPELALTDVAYSLATTRTRFAHRGVVIAADRAESMDGLTALATGADRHGVVQGTGTGPKIAFLFPGEGGQRPGMGRDLYRAFPVFAEALDEMCAHFDANSAWSVRDLLLAEEGEYHADGVDMTLFSQDALFALQVALFRLLEHWGVRPDFLFGHSVGEMAAATVAGVFSLADAAEMMATRVRLVSELMPATGGMAALRGSEPEVLDLLAEYPEQAAVAAVNGPSSVVVTGDEGPIGEIVARWVASGRKAKRLPVNRAFHSRHMDVLLDDFADCVRGLRREPPRIPIVSAVSALPLSAEEVCSAEYWPKQVRRPTRFMDCVRWLESAGVDTFVELGANGLLAAMVRDCLVDPANATVVPTLRSGHPDVRSLLSATAQAHVKGVPVDFAAVLEEHGACPVTLPTYAFQRERYPVPAGTQAADHGMTAVAHPMLTAVTEVAGTGELLYTGRVSLAAQPWLSDHVVVEQVVVPGSVFVELALWLGGESGCARLDELVLDAPLVVPENGELLVQASVGAADTDGRRALTVSSREPGGEWTRHARGAVVPAATRPSSVPAQWPPADAAEVPVDELYQRFAEHGHGYGPVFQRLTAAWRSGDQVFAEAEPVPGKDAFGVHPALLEAAVQAAGITAPRTLSAVRGVSLSGAAGPVARIHVSGVDSDAVTFRLADETGAVILEAESMDLRPARREHLTVAAGNHRSLFRLDWSTVEPGQASIQIMAATQWATVGPDPLGLADVLGAGHAADLSSCVSAVEAGAPVPDFVVVQQISGSTGDALSVMREWLGARTLEAATLVVVTRGAVSTAAGEDVPDLANAPLWGLARSAQAEHPGRIVVLDVDSPPVSARLLSAAVATGEPQLAVRGGELKAPRLARYAHISETSFPPGSVLITGGTGRVGSALARHVVSRHGVRNLVLVSRTGRADELVSELTALGASVAVHECDVADRAALADVLARVPADHPLTAVIHAAHHADDAVLEALTPERLDAVLRTKMDGLVHLHELTGKLDLPVFVVVNSAATLLGALGQAGACAADAFAEAFVHHRRAHGLAGTVVAWGRWAHAEGDEPPRGGVVPLRPSRALDLFDAALALDEPVVVPVGLNIPMLRARSAHQPAILAGLAGGSGARAGRRAEASLAASLLAASGPERARILLDVVGSAVASLSESLAPRDIEPSRPFAELGFDSLMAVEFVARLSAGTGLRLPTTTIFDHPTPAAFAAYLEERLCPRDTEPVRPAHDGGATERDALLRMVESLSNDQLFRFIDGFAVDSPA